MRRPPTGADIERILDRSDDPDVAWLAEEIDRLAGQVSDCWLELDAIARGSNPWVINMRRAAALLHKQKAPGWKE